MSRPEVVLWLHLRGRQLDGLRFRRQHPLGIYILDFYCGQARLAVEVDGQVHASGAAEAYDLRRDAWCAAQGIETLRVSGRSVLAELDGVLAAIEAAARRRIEEGSVLNPSGRCAATSPAARKRAGEDCR